MCFPGCGGQKPKASPVEEPHAAGFLSALERANITTAHLQSKLDNPITLSDTRRIMDAVTPYLLMPPEDCGLVDAAVTSREDCGLVQRRDEADDRGFAQDSIADCSSRFFWRVLTGRRREKPIRIVDVVLFGYELDLLEIRFHELDDVVAHTVLLENELSMKGVPKPLMWQEARTQERFARFANRTSSAVVLTRDTPVKKRGLWPWERATRQAAFRVVRMVDMQEGLELDNDDVIIYGDLDEMPSGESLRHLQQCEPRPGVFPLSGGLLFFIGRLDEVYLSDSPVPGWKYLLERPSYHRWHDAKRIRRLEQPKRPGGYLPGGWHLSDYPFLPFILIKRITISESRALESHIWRDVLRGEVRPDFRPLMKGWKKRLTRFDALAAHNARYRMLGEVAGRGPWYLLCNRERFPAWFWMRDRRLD
ncbi:unnamed protein product [Vitrella brassicaformis CCMP3155]|uniref:Uncharacterized protein n=3 Tax=Vitrella brassicaformis TaxID=1169539 RepID=A0A0G4GRW6_VITBC|nr:unnamed protein product [Vitrella brassicaformis CCMP3155]|mmetsp:Transcript_41289/g.117302  ORF Transcript_41289/g.117302 Transcript_41289/m.117302 type:complete len:421 (-) Transcript_41289:134-1396(-)|eukprot:CEM33343.1 unnamed protein product [Vitrella brassicaformis CCMP3155]